jgi:hypothetical protein
MLQLYLSKGCRRGHDVTADFMADVVGDMSKELQVPIAEEKYCVHVSVVPFDFVIAY